MHEGSGFEAVFEDAPVAIWYEDFSGVKKYLASLRAAGVRDLPGYLNTHPQSVRDCLRCVHIRHVNRLARQFYGADSPSELAESFPELFDDATLEIFRGELIAFVRGERFFSAELEAVSLSGERRLVQMNVALLQTGSDDWSEIVVSFTDLSERRKLEQALEQANTSLRRSNLALEQFAYAAAHDLIEPLRTIGLYAEMLRKMNVSALGQVAQDSLNFILSSTQRMRRMISDLLEFAQVLEKPGGAAAFADATAIVQETIAALTAAIAETGAIIHSDRLPPVAVQPSHLRQIFQNLISNALKYKRPGCAPCVDVMAWETPAEIQFCVMDNGSGIPIEYQSQIFEIFHRLHGRDVEGAGIGLALCKRIVEHYHGKIWVESEGTGSRFYFTLPKAQSSGPYVVPAIPEQSRSRAP